MDSRIAGIILFTLLYPATAPLTRFVPNPMVPGADVALNMIIPVLAGYFFGPLSGAAAGGIGAAIAALIQADLFDCMAILPHAIMGLLAGWAGNHRLDMAAAGSVVVGHFLNLLFFTRLGLMVISREQIGGVILGLVTETSIDIVAVILVIALIKNQLYRKDRW